jgi:hypothetical protein
MIRRIVLLLAVLSVLPVAAHAAGGAARAPMFGPRFGASVDPDQFVVGGQYTSGELAPSVTFDPNLELGFGDNETVIALNMDGHYHLSLKGSDWAPYFGLGVAVNFVSVDHPAPIEDESETDVGVNLILGTEVPTRSGSRFFTELKLGLGDTSSLKIIAGWNFSVGK